MSAVGATATIAHGYTMDDVESAARRGVQAARSITPRLEPEEAHAAAYHAVVVLLFESSERPTWWTLVNAAQYAANREARSRDRALGLRADAAKTPMGSPREGAAFAPSFVKYWRPLITTETDDGFSDELCERLALPDVLALLTRRQYQAVVALAVHGDITEAARALGMREPTLRNYLCLARSRIKAAWHAPETPARLLSDDSCRRGHSREKYGYLDKNGARGCRECGRLNASRNGRRRRVNLSVERSLDERQPETAAVSRR